MRVVAVAASLAGALALTACSGDGDSDAKDDSGPSASATTGAGTGGGTGGSASASGDLEGSWLATTDGKAVVLVVTGTEAGLFATGGTVCSGTAGEQDGMRMIRLKCPDGSKDRAVGMVDSVGKSQLKVDWEGGLGAETYTRAQGGKLPTGLPTAGLGS
ncbi:MULTISPECIES: hypothetical protein [unclassified Streptomyces]|uniref:hypothetical protein n=1 Tax=unclassified Streptomyces TaxID=2593676 RepID=UPI0023663A6E|nr:MULTISPECIES: hypothetical protein [unclassified Streptomyces]MDF3149045.1 hypothetical protein [Streptomyces sp. T21Q-yed]WDF44749.1 hypothetical protein PBV52_27295 [Streptomyces sp. T12]